MEWSLHVRDELIIEVIDDPLFIRSKDNVFRHVIVK